ncbi:MAG: DNA-directed RNA polymerase subunit beta' [Chloroflexota bacterium]
MTNFALYVFSLASPERIKNASYGEVTKPETINYRTLRPEKDGLFCERIFGPTKDYECYCGKYKKIRYRGVVCDKCGVLVEHSRIRRVRMGHVQLAAPVAHIWFSKGVPSRVALLLDISPRNLERVVYFAQHAITSVDGDAVQKKAVALNERFAAEVSEREKVTEEKVAELEPGASAGDNSAIEETNLLRGRLVEDKSKLQEQFRASLEELSGLTMTRLLTESQYQDLKSKYGELFEASMGAEAMLKLLQQLDTEELYHSLLEEVRTTSGQRRKKASKRLHIVAGLRRSGNRPEWMVLQVLPVLPPELRPIVQLDGGRFASSDLNDLYRRVITRNNRLRRLIEIGAPEIILRNEKRMLQQAVDALIDNGRQGRALTSGNHRLKSLSDVLRGKQGRFRQNLLGKRVDYSGRSVIVVGPQLKLHQCGLPRRMALELFKPFVMRRLVELGYAHNIKSARRQLERPRVEVWNALEEVVRDRPVMLNRAPTLHRLSIQAFEPVLIDGSAIQLHPLVCGAFNADFDGDQMAVHVPLSREAVAEAREQLLSTHNMLLPSNGEPVTSPSLDMVFGCYFLTGIRPGSRGEGKQFASMDDAVTAYDLGAVEHSAEIEVRDESGKRMKTSVGRIIFNQVLPPELRRYDEWMTKGALKRLIGECHHRYGDEAAAKVLDDLKDLGFEYATRSGLTITLKDLEVPAGKAKLLEETDEKLAVLESQFNRGLITEDERYGRTIEIWTEATDRITEIISQSFDRYGNVYMMANSGAKGNISQIRQMCGMRGLMTEPSGKIIDFPIRASFREGLSVIEYFISTHGARKGLADTALRTSNSGYLTRRLIDVAQDLLVNMEDCGTPDGLWLTEPEDKGLLPSLYERLVGRFAAADIADPKTGEILVARNGELTEPTAKLIVDAGITSVFARSPSACRAPHGVCQRCYGRDLARRELVKMGSAVGIVAAQSIGEPGTQLTLRTFHTGGIVGPDITSGLPRVEQLFEARSPPRAAILSEIDGMAEVTQGEDGTKITVTSTESYLDEYLLPPGAELQVKEGDWVDMGAVLFQLSSGKTSLPVAETYSPVARISGQVAIKKRRLYIRHEAKEEHEYPVLPTAQLLVKSGDMVKGGDKLTDGIINPQDVLHIQGREAAQRYLVEEIQKVYRSQGVNINDKHIETIVCQMLARVRVESAGDTALLPGELIDRFDYERVNADILAEGGEPAMAESVLLGITRASLNTDSWLAAASFQETTRVLAEAAVQGKVDILRGLKENVIIGKLIPARFQLRTLPPPPQAPELTLGEDGAALEEGAVALQDGALAPEASAVSEEAGEDVEGSGVASVKADGEVEEDSEAEKEE